MTKEEILEKSRSENAGKDIEDLEVHKTAAKIAYFSSFGFFMLVSILNFIFTKKISVQCWIVFFGMLTVAFFVKYAKLKKRHEFWVAIVYLIFFIMCVAAFISELSGLF